MISRGYVSAALDAPPCWQNGADICHFLSTATEKKGLKLEIKVITILRRLLVKADLT